MAPASPLHMTVTRCDNPTTANQDDSFNRLAVFLPPRIVGLLWCLLPAPHAFLFSAPGSYVDGSQRVSMLLLTSRATERVNCDCPLLG